ncbi:MAG: Fe-S cluster assembly protein SufD [Anaerolineales bacterium]|nr:Fe-S cluster assembly protein SufD [Anaerolineales bacterium]
MSITEAPSSNGAPAKAPSAYPRTVIVTGRQKAEPVITELQLAKADVQALSKFKRDPEWYARRRLAALKQYQATPMPSLTDEAWRRTDLRGFKWGAVVLPQAAPAATGRAARVPASLLKPLAGRSQGGQLVSVDGRVAAYELAAALKRQKVIFTDFFTAARKYPALVKKYLGQVVPIAEGKFAALAETLADYGLFIYVPKKARLELPLHSGAWLTGAAHFGRLVIVVDDGASATVVHEAASPEGAGAALHAATVEVQVGQRAHRTFVELQSLGRNVWNFTHERVRVGRDSKVDWIFVAQGTHLTKNFSEIDLDGEGATGKMSGYYFSDGEQHLDHDTQQNHNAPHTTSDLLFKGALKDRSRSVWQGMIYVAPGAQKTDGYQANRNLVLSQQARADSIPGLEIMADDVRCTHGATVGQLEEEHIFYLMSRGMNRPEAERLVVDGFFDPILQRIPFEGVRERLKRSIEAKMG